MLDDWYEDGRLSVYARVHRPKQSARRGSGPRRLGRAATTFFGLASLMTVSVSGDLPTGSTSGVLALSAQDTSSVERAVALSWDEPIRLMEVRAGERTFVFRQAITLVPVLEGDLLVATIPGLGDQAAVGARSLEGLVAEVGDYLAFAWTEYVDEDEARLAPDGLELRRALKALVSLA